MSYVSKEWITGETITAEKLNNLEEGVQEALESGEGDDSEFFIVNVTKKLSSDPTVDKTFAEIKDAYDNGKIIICRLNKQTVPSDDMPMNTYDYMISYFWQSNFFDASHTTVSLASNALYAEEIVISESGVSYAEKRYALTESN